MSGSWMVAAATTAFALLSFEEAGAGELRQEVRTQRCVALPLVHTDAVWAARKLKAVLRTDAIAADEETNTVFVRASAETIEKGRDTLKWLDVPFVFRVVDVKHVDTAETAKTLGLLLNLLARWRDDREVSISADESGHAILVCAPRVQAEAIMHVIRRLDATPK